MPRPAWVVLSGDFMSAMGSGLTLPVLFIYAHQVRHVGYTLSGLVVAAIALASLAGNPLGGLLADRLTPRRAVMTGLVVSAAGSVALAFARTAPELLGAAALLGLGVSVTWPAQDALLAAVAGPTARSAVFSVRHATFNAGSAVGALIAAGVVSVAHPVVFTAVYLADAASFLVFIPVLVLLRQPRPADAPAGDPGQAAPSGRYRQVLADKSFRRVWLLLAVIVTLSFGQFESTFPGFAARPGGIGPHGLGLAFAANTVTVAVVQLPVLRWLAGRRRTTAVALAAMAWAACWAAIAIGGHLGSGAAAVAAFVIAMAIFAVGETLFSPTLPAVINDLAPPEAAGRYNGLGVLAFTTGFLIGPAGGTAALSAAGGVLFLLLAAACIGAAAAALRLGRRLAPAVNTIELPGAAAEPAAGETATAACPAAGDAASAGPIEPDRPAHPRAEVAPEIA